MPDSNNSNDAVQAAKALAIRLDDARCEYALGGAIALGYWAEPRGTLHVDVTLFLPLDRPTACVRLLQSIGCELNADQSQESLATHNFCQVKFLDVRLDVFLPMIPFYQRAKNRRKTALIDDQPVNIWDAETLCVFKMMFFRRKDLADAEQILRLQAEKLDRQWITEQLIEIYGQRDPRIQQWQELLAEIPV